MIALYIRTTHSGCSLNSWIHDGCPPPKLYESSNSSKIGNTLLDTELDSNNEHVLAS